MLSTFAHKFMTLLHPFASSLDLITFKPGFDPSKFVLVEAVSPAPATVGSCKDCAISGICEHQQRRDRCKDYRSK